MARHRTPLQDSPAWDIYQELKAYSLKQQAIPNQNAFYVNIFAPKGYALTRGGFDYWWQRLAMAGWITIEPSTHAVTVRDVLLTDRNGETD